MIEWILWAGVAGLIAYIISLYFEPVKNKFQKVGGLFRKTKSVPYINTCFDDNGEIDMDESPERGSAFEEHFLRLVKNSKVRMFTAFTLLSAAILFVPAFRAGVWENYLKLLIPTVLINLLAIFYGCSQKANRYSILGICLLNNCAALSRAAFGDATNVGRMIYIHMLLGVVIVCIFALIHRWLKKTARWQWFCLIVLAVIVLFSCGLVGEINGARSWVEVFGVSIQLTEIAKFLYLCFIGILFSDKDSVISKIIISALGTLICCGLLVVICNELGTVLVICLSYFFTVMLTLNNLTEREKRKRIAGKVKITFLILAIVFVAAGVAGFKYVDSNIGVWNCPDEECTVRNSSSAEVCNGCGWEKTSLGAAFKCPLCKFTTWKEIELLKDEDGNVKLVESCPNCNNILILKGSLGNITRKLYDRFAIAYKFDNVKGTDIAYQTEQCHSAMKVGGLFGDMKTIVDVPRYTIDTDSVVATLTNRLGLLFVVIVLFAFFLIFASIKNASSPLRVVILFAFIFQAVITYLGTMNLIPATGIGVPLISRGGSNLIVNYLSIYLILSSVKLAQGGKKSEKQ